jgi:hypothetical protein
MPKGIAREVNAIAGNQLITAIKAWVSRHSPEKMGRGAVSPGIKRLNPKIKRLAIPV